MAIFKQSIDHLATKTDLELVRAEIQTLRAELTATRAEAAELYDKAYHMHARTAKRLRDAQRDEPEPVDQVPAPQVDDITARVLARREARRGVSA